MPSNTVVKYPNGFTCVDNRVLTSATFRSIKPISRLVYVYVAQYRNNDTGIAFPSQETIAQNAAVSVPTVRRAIKELAEVGLLDKIPNKGRHNTYVFRYDGVENDSSAAQEFDYPAEPAPVQVEIEVEQPTPSPKLALVAKPRAIRRHPAHLETVAECEARLEARAYGGMNTTEAALAMWYDHYAHYCGRTPAVGSWPAVSAHAKRLVNSRNGDMDRVFEWVKCGFDCAVEGRICFKTGPAALIISSLLNEYNANQIKGWIEEANMPLDQLETKLREGGRK